MFLHREKRLSLLWNGKWETVHHNSSSNTPVVLHVEDDDGAAYLFRTVLRDQAADVEVFRLCNGEDGILFLRRTGVFADAPRPNIVVLDLHLPKKNGHEILAEIRQAADLQGVPVIMFTSSVLPGDRQEAMSLGATDYVSKAGNLEGFTVVAEQILKYVSKSQAT